MFDDIRIIYLANPLTSGALVFVAGALVGAHLNYLYGVKLARRIEFNLLADPARLSLRSELDSPWPGVKAPIELDAIVDHLRFYKRRGYRVAVGGYKQAREQNNVRDPEYGSLVGYSRTDHIEVAIEALLPYLQRR